ncbi:hypothetical protein [Nocardia paucivorans]|uniref:hypothetical protein n=1 Tax=Nocardia paucivorans TaxID=114259 RepID=UPI0002F2E17E|nr:hypothetical protein [Nocardia paucivorans]
MWQYALWGIAGAAAHCGVTYPEVSTRVEEWSWLKSNGGPGGGVYSSWVMVDPGIAGPTTRATACGEIIDTTLPYSAPGSWSPPC